MKWERGIEPKPIKSSKWNAVLKKGKVGDSMELSKSDAASLGSVARNNGYKVTLRATGKKDRYRIFIISAPETKGDKK